MRPRHHHEDVGLPSTDISQSVNLKTSDMLLGNFMQNASYSSLSDFFFVSLPLNFAFSLLCFVCLFYFYLFCFIAVVFGGLMYESFCFLLIKC